MGLLSTMEVCIPGHEDGRNGEPNEVRRANQPNEHLLGASQIELLRTHPVDKGVWRRVVNSPERVRDILFAYLLPLAALPLPTLLLCIELFALVVWIGLHERQREQHAISGHKGSNEGHCGVQLELAVPSKQSERLIVI